MEQLALKAGCYGLRGQSRVRPHRVFIRGRFLKFICFSCRLLKISSEITNPRDFQHAFSAHWNTRSDFWTRGPSPCPKYQRQYLGCSTTLSSVLLPSSRVFVCLESCCISYSIIQRCQAVGKVRTVALNCKITISIMHERTYGRAWGFSPPAALENWTTSQSFMEI